jgi:GDSL-like lipase/acylhydrolase family protein
VVALLVAAILAGCSSAAARSPSPSTTAPASAATAGQSTSSVPHPSGSVYVLGDSLTVGVEPYLAQRLPGRSVEIDGKNGRTTAGGLAIVEARTAPIPPTVVVALGTNDQESAPQFSTLIDQLMARFGGRRVVWVNIATARDQALNAELIAAKSRYPNLEVIDWASIIAAHPEDVLADGIHYTLSGYQLRASVMATTIQGRP